MTGWRTLLCGLVVLIVAGGARAQSYPLAEGPLTGGYFHIDMAMTLDGSIQVQQEGKNVTLKQIATAQHDYTERILEAGTVLADKSARLYSTARAEITTDKDRSTRTFRADRRFLVAQRIKDQTVCYCPLGLLTGDELELTDHFDTLALPGLLPGREVKIGATWKIANAAAQSLLDLDGLINQNLTCTLAKVANDLAHVSVSGTATGIDMGASVKMKIIASYQFDLKARRLISLEWKQTDQREPGPISPSFQAEVITRLKRTPVEPIQDLNDFALVKIPTSKGLPEKFAPLTYADPQNRYHLVHARNWHLVSQSGRQMVLRLLERGDFVAQVTITPWRKTSAGHHVSVEQFKEAMTQAPGWEPENIDKGAQIDLPTGYWCHRISASGALNGVKTVQYFYLVAGPQGDQVVLTFTMPPAQAPNLNTRDLDLVRGLTFPGKKDNAVSTLPGSP